MYVYFLERPQFLALFLHFIAKTLPNRPKMPIFTEKFLTMMDWKEKLGAAFGVEPLPASDAEQNVDADNSRGDALSQQAGQVVHVMIDRKGRHGKQATLVTNLQCDDDALLELARELKLLCGVGGSARGGEILLQGDQREKVAAHLRQKGFKVK